MRVLHLLQSPHFSGAENVVCQIIRMFRTNLDFEMAYCSQDGQIREALLEREITFYPIRDLRTSEVKRVIDEYKPDIIHAHDMRASFVAAMCCGKKTLISHVHNNSFESRVVSIKSIAYILAGIKAKHIFWVSKSSYNEYFFKKFFERKSSVLQNIIDVDALYEKMQCDENNYSYDIVYVGRLTYPKNPERLIEILSKVCEKQKDVKIAIIGTGDLEENVKTLAHEKKLDKNIDFWGFCSNPLKIVNSSKVMIMTSRWEGIPMCALEAQSLGVPIVSTPTDGLCEIINDGKNGFLSEEDCVLVKMIVRLLENKELWKKMSNNAKDIMKILMNKNNYIESIKKVYVESLERDKWFL